MFLTIKNIPKVSWSSKEPFNLKPKFSTFFFLCFGLTLFGIGEGLLLVSYTGASPWSVLAQGISKYVNLSIGTITFLISLFVIFLWIFLSQKPGMGTILNAIIIAIMIDICLKYVSTPQSFELKILLAIFSVIITGIGSGIYLTTNLGPGKYNLAHFRYAALKSLSPLTLPTPSAAHAFSTLLFMRIVQGLFLNC